MIYERPTKTENKLATSKIIYLPRYTRHNYDLLMSLLTLGFGLIFSRKTALGCIDPAPPVLLTGVVTRGVLPALTVFSVDATALLFFPEEGIRTSLATGEAKVLAKGFICLGEKGFTGDPEGLGFLASEGRDWGEVVFFVAQLLQDIPKNFISFQCN